MALAKLAFIYGLCVMFYFMMAVFFFRKNNELLSRLVGGTMLIIGLQYIKDLYFSWAESGADNYLWMTMTALDMVAVPLYVFILFGLLRPEALNVRTVLLHELPFVILPALFITLKLDIFYYINVAWAGIYGVGYAVWTLVAIPKYHRLLNERFSYAENIDLNWLRYILLSFFAILALWILDCVVVHIGIEAMYMLGSLTNWMFICYFIYRHESVIEELAPLAATEIKNGEEPSSVELRERILHLFETQQIFLNPHLKLSDVASMTNSNRTYVSRFFNNSHGKTFFEFVNAYRVNYALELLRTSNKRLEEIAEESGFSSRQSFHRVFTKLKGQTPEQIRSNSK